MGHADATAEVRGIRVDLPEDTDLEDGWSRWSRRILVATVVLAVVAVSVLAWWSLG